MAIETLSKRQRIGSDIEWCCTFDQTQSLRSLIDVVGDVLKRVSIQIQYIKGDGEDGNYFLCIDSIDPGHVCMIKARLLCEKTSGNIDNCEFCVDSSLLNLCLKGIPPHYTIDIMKKTNSADICISAYELISKSHRTSISLPTLVDDSDTMKLTDMEYEFTIEIDLSVMRQIVKMTTQLHAQDLELSVCEEPLKKDVIRSVFSITADGDARQEHHFVSATVNENGNSKVIRAATDASGPDICSDSWATKYKDSFGANYLSLFLKSMDQRLLTIKLSENKPLIISYPLGAEHSYIIFVLAPKTGE